MEVEAIYSPTIQDGPVVRFQFGRRNGTYREIFSGKERIDWSAEINASRNGVSLNGNVPIYSDQAAIDAIQRLFGLAWDAYQRMKWARDPHDIAKEVVARFNDGDPLRVRAEATVMDGHNNG